MSMIKASIEHQWPKETAEKQISYNHSQNITYKCKKNKQIKFILKSKHILFNQNSKSIIIIETKHQKMSPNNSKDPVGKTPRQGQVAGFKTKSSMFFSINTKFQIHPKLEIHRFHMQSNKAQIKSMNSFKKQKEQQFFIIKNCKKWGTHKADYGKFSLKTDKQNDKKKKCQNGSMTESTK